MNIDQAAALYEQRKQEHAAASKKLDEAHAALLGLCASRNEGAIQTLGEAYKVTVTYGVNRTVDPAALNAVWPQLPEGARRVFPMKPSIDLKELRHWQANEPEVYAVIAQAVTAKPSKPSIKVESIEQQQKEAA